MKAYAWYQTLKKPRWAPPQGIFGPVWTVLYILIVISYGYVGYSVATGALGVSVLVPFALNLVFNLLFSPIQFGLRNSVLALIDVLLVLATLVWGMLTILPLVHWIAYINIPYLLWTTFASILQITITMMNWEK